ncbi:MAG: hypothetical protein K9K21_08820 [Desulfotignum sp.]|nr:hypothetical protein [Desulfotignum sp.]MCF8113934.1 hypothetical protein [Desulfotignum sp.]
MPFFNISDLIWDEIIYPRSARKQQTIDAYSEALAAGAQFPPIIIQPVVNYPAPNTSLYAILLLILDGIHRWSAYKVLGLTEIEAVLWQDQPLDYATCKDDMLLESARRNISHGDRLSQTDKRQVARDIVSRDPECHLTEEMLAGSLGVTQQTVNNWIKDIRARQNASRDSTILRLNRLALHPGTGPDLFRSPLFHQKKESLPGKGRSPNPAHLLIAPAPIHAVLCPVF